MKPKSMRLWGVFLLRWIIGISFLTAGIQNIHRYPTAAVLALLFAFLLTPITEQLLLKKLKLKLHSWQKMLVAGVVFFLFGSSLPKSSTLPQSVEPSPAVEASLEPAAAEVDQVQIASPSAGFLKVVSVTDGDTFKVQNGKRTETVRIVGIDTPEILDPRRPVQCFGKEASERAKALLTGKSVRLEVDETQQDRDRYGRLLRFAFLEDGTDIGLLLIAEGYAQESLYSSVPHKYHTAYVSANTRAKASKVGLWADDACLGEDGGE